MTPQEKLADDIEELYALLSAYRSSLYNLTNDGWPQIDQQTQRYQDALGRIERLVDEVPDISNVY